MKQIIILIGVLTFIGSQATAQDTIGARIDKRLNSMSSADQHSIRGIRILIDVLRSDIMPTVSVPDRKEAQEIADLFTRLINDEIAEPTIWSLKDAATRFSELLVRIDPSSFDRRYGLVETYSFFATRSYLVDDSYGPNYHEKVTKRVTESKIKTMEASRQLVKDFPKEPDAYGLLAYNTFEIGKDLDKATKVAHQCLTIDKNFQYCKDLIKFFKEEKRRKPGDTRRREANTELIWRD